MTNEQLDVREPTNSSKNKTEQKPVAAAGKLCPGFLSQLHGSGVQRAGEGSLVHVKACYLVDGAKMANESSSVWSQEPAAVISANGHWTASQSESITGRSQGRCERGSHQDPCHLELWVMMDTGKLE